MIISEYDVARWEGNIVYIKGQAYKIVKWLEDHWHEAVCLGNK